MRCEAFGDPSERNRICGLMVRGTDIYASRAASMTSKADKKERRRGWPSIKDGALLDTASGFLSDIVEAGMWITRTLMTVKLTVSVYPAPAEISNREPSPNSNKTERTTKKATYPGSRIVRSVRVF